MTHLTALNPSQLCDNRSAPEYPECGECECHPCCCADADALEGECVRPGESLQRTLARLDMATGYSDDTVSLVRWRLSLETVARLAAAA